MKYFITAKFGKSTKRFEYTHSSVKELEDYIARLFGCKVDKLYVVDADESVELLVKENALRVAFPRADGGISIHVNFVYGKKDIKNGPNGIRIVENDGDVGNSAKGSGGFRFVHIDAKQECTDMKVGRCNDGSNKKRDDETFVKDHYRKKKKEEDVLQDDSGDRTVDIVGKQRSKDKKERCDAGSSGEAKDDKTCKKDEPTRKKKKTCTDDNGDGEYRTVDIGWNKRCKDEREQCDAGDPDKKQDDDTKKDAPKMKKGKEEKKDATAKNKSKEKTEEFVDVPAKKEEKNCSKEEEGAKDVCKNVEKVRFKFDDPKRKVGASKKADGKEDGKGEKYGEKKETLKPKRIVFNDSDCEKEDSGNNAGGKSSDGAGSKSLSWNSDNIWYKLRKQEGMTKAAENKREGGNAGDKSIEQKPKGSDAGEKKEVESKALVVPTKEMQIGDEGDEVKQLQVILQGMNFLKENDYEEGTYCCRTASGVKDFRDTYGCDHGDMMVYDKIAAHTLKQAHETWMIVKEFSAKKGDKEN